MKRSLRTVAAALAIAALASVGASNASAVAATETDGAFSRQMQMHHSMAIQIAMMAAEEGEHRAIRTTARNIVKRQRHEVDRLMRIAARRDIAPSATHGNTQMIEDLDTLGMTRMQTGTHRDITGLLDADPFDRKFIHMMLPYHRGAIRMARAELRRGKVGELRAMARAIVQAQTKEIRQMKEWRAAWYEQRLFV